MGKIEVSQVPSDKNLTPDKGWMNMDLKWLVSEENGSKHITVGRTLFAPGRASKHALHRHNDAEEVIIVLQGQGNSIVNGETTPMGPGDVCYIPQGAPHSFENASDDKTCELIFVYSAPSLEKAGYEVL